MKKKLVKSKREKKTKSNGRNHGAVSVFLVGVLVPCLVISSLCIDLSRLVLSKSTAEAAADLSLNSLLTYYDFDLKDWYGMAASCQNIDEFYAGTASYFLESLKSSDLSDDQISTVYENFISTFMDTDTINDMLLISSTTDTSNMISSIPDANLTNASIVKSEIVEFMKYRAPIEITSGVLSNIFSEDGDGIAVADSISEFITNKPNKNIEEAELKKEYYEAEGEFSKNAYKSYCALKEYENLHIKNDTLEKDLQDAKATYDLYKEIHTVITRQLINTQGLAVFSHIKSDTISATTYTKETSGIYTQKVEKERQNEDEEVTYTYYTSHEKMKTELQTLKSKISDFNTKLTNLNTKLNDIANKSIGEADEQICEIQWWVKANQYLSCTEYTDFVTSSKNLVSQYNKVLAIKACVDDGGYDSLASDVVLTEEDYNSWESTFGIVADKENDDIEDLLSKVYKKYVDTDNGCAKKLIEGYLGETISGTDNYSKFVKTLETASSSHINDITYTNIILSNGQSIDVSLSNQADVLTEDGTLIGMGLDKLAPLLSTEKWMGKYKEKKSLYNIKEEADNVGNCHDSWKQEASEQDTSMKDEDYTQLTDGSIVRIDGSKIQSLIDRLKNINEQLSSVITSLSITYGGTLCRSIRDYNTFFSKTQTKVTADGINACTNNQQLNSYINSTFLELVEPDSVSDALSHKDDSSYNPDLTIDSPDGYIFLDELYNDVGVKDISNEENDQESGKDATKNKEDEAKNKDRYHGGCTGGINVSFAGTDKTFNLGTAILDNISSIFENIIKGSASNIGVNLRDSLYVTTYALNMFSYATYDYQGRYDLLKSQTDGENKVKNLKTSTAVNEYNNLLGAADQRETWLSTNLLDSYNKSLTNKMINNTNNYAYEAELEYILFGKSTCAANVKEMYSTLFAIRYSLNLVSAFQNFWGLNTKTGKAFNTAAEAIATATMGVIPIPVTIVILIGVITAFETATDLERLENGFPVELYKSEANQWWCSFDYSSSQSDSSSNPESIGAVLSSLTGLGERTNSDKGITYRDYIALFLIMGFNANNDTSQQMYQRLAAVIQTNMVRLTGDSNYSLSKSLIYVKLKAEMQIEPLMMDIPMFSSPDNVLLQNDGWRTYEIEITRGFF